MKTLMVIEHIDWLLDSLCSVTETITFEEYGRKLIAISSNEVMRSYSKTNKSIQMYIYWLTTLELFDGDHAKHFSVSPLGERLCQYRKKNKTKYQILLSNILLKNKRVGSFFRKYKEIIEERNKQLKPITRNDIKSYFKTKHEKSTGAETERVLFKFSQEAGIVKATKDGHLIVKTKRQEKLTLEKFKKAVFDAYNSIVNAVSEFHLKRKYVEIYKVRSLVESVLSMMENDEFDKWFTILLKSNEGKSISIYPAAPQWFTEQKFDSDKKTSPKGLKTEDVTFRFEDKLYVFMSISGK
ncbi:MAG: hypothetical protein ACREBB_10210 [Nitrosotalea sp.]